MENANYPGGAGGDHGKRHDGIRTYQKCRYGGYPNPVILLINNLSASLNLYEIIFVCIKSSLYEPCTDGRLKYILSRLFHPQKNKYPFSCQQH